MKLTLPIANDNYSANDSEACNNSIYELEITQHPSTINSAATGQDNSAKNTLSANLMRALTAGLVLTWTILVITSINMTKAPLHAFPIYAQMTLTTLSGLSLVWIGARQHKALIREIGTLTALLATITNLYLINLIYNIHMPLPVFLVITAVLASVMAWVTKSRVAIVLTAIFSCLSAIFILQTGIVHSTVSAIVPLSIMIVIFIVNIAMMNTWDRQFTSFLCCLGLYVLIGALLVSANTNGHLSLANTAVLIFIAGIMHAGFGHLLIARNKRSGQIHLALGFMGGLIGALLMQDYWHNPDQPPWVHDGLVASFSLSGVPFWFMAIGLLLALFATLTMMRIRNGAQSVSAATVTLAALLCAPFAFIAIGKDIPLPFIDMTIPPLWAEITLGGIMMGLAYSLFSTGHKLRSKLLILLALIGISAEIFLIKDTLVQSSEYLLTFSALALTTIFFAASPTHTTHKYIGYKVSRPSPSSQHSLIPITPKWKQAIFALIVLGTPMLFMLGHFRSAQGNPQITTWAKIQSVYDHDYGHTLALTTPLSDIDLSALVAPKHIRQGANVTVYFNGTDTAIAYPYALTKNIQRASCDPKHCFALSGEVKHVDGSNITVEYPFQSLFTATSTYQLGDRVELDLAIPPSGDAVTLSAQSQSNDLAQGFELVPIPTLDAFIKMGARSAPAK